MTPASSAKGTAKAGPAGPNLRDIQEAMRIVPTRLIAQGGMGALYEARQIGAEGFEKTVAIKTMLAKLTDARYADLFVAEAKLVANLVHENIVQIYHLGRAEAGYFIVMEYVRGLTLADILSHHQAKSMILPEPLAVFIASRIARGLAYAHKRCDPCGQPLGIVHRDVCPANILVTTEGLPKLADFGVAKVAGRLLKGDEWIVGKRAYMAPEQAEGAAVDFRADLFSLGAVLFELLAGTPLRPQPSESGTKTDEPAGSTRFPLPERIPVELRNLLDRMLASDPAARYPDTDTLARDLEYYIYRSGYGPTIKTLETYLREHFPFLYKPDAPRPEYDCSREVTLLKTFFH